MQKHWGLGRGLFAASFVLVLLAVNVVITHNYFTAQNPGMNDFLPRWEAGRSFWLEGENPYSDAVSLQIQIQIFGRAAEPGEDFSLFAYPFYAVFYVLPTIGLPYAWASAVWLVLLEVCLVAGLYLLLGALRWRPGVLMQAALVVFMLLNYYSFRGLILGQMSHIVFMLTALTLWAMSRGRDTLAGVALALATVKPQMGFLLVPFLLLWALRVGRLRLLWGFLGTFGALMVASFILEPSWFIGWVEQVLLYPTYTRDGSPVWILLEFFLGWSPWAGYAVRAVLVGVMLWAWWQVLIQQRHNALLWSVALTLAVTHTAGPRTATPHFVVFSLVLLVMLQRLASARQPLISALVLFALLVIPWWHFLTTILEPNLENLSMFLPLIGLVWVVLLLTRRYWLQMHPFQRPPV